ncbi:MAG: NHL repeat-containing protein [Planctomycetes bacterium]|nr:NHL repeat-containing protein [Planctomycetota bacterium]MBL7042897.1 NHL repeat-containing protein [Pirellulaceae bacterium]
MQKLIIGCLTCLVAVLPKSATAQMEYPLSIAVAESGKLYIADRNLPGVWRVDGSDLSTLFKGSKRFRTPLNAVRCVALDGNGSVLAGDSATREVYRLGEDGKPIPLTDGGIGIPMGIAVDSKGQLLVSDLELHRIWKVPGEGGKPALLAEVPAPRGVCIDGDDNLWVVSHGKDQVVRVSPDGKVEAIVEGRPFQFPHTIVLDQDKTAYVCDGYARAIWKVPQGGKPTKWISGEPLVNPVGLARHHDGLLVVDPRANAVFEIDATGKPTKLELKLKE